MSRVTLCFLLGVSAVMAVSSAMVLTFQHRLPHYQARIGGPFTMTEATGAPVTENDLLGKPTAIVFGFTGCPEVCPTTLLMLSNVLKQMGPGASRLNVVFVTVDPERDTPEQMRLYLSSFDPHIRGFTGNGAQVAAMAQTYQIFYRRIPIEGGGYTIDHFAGVLLFDATGALVGEVPYGEPEPTTLAKLQTLIRPAACMPGEPAPVDLRSGATTNDLCRSS